MDLGIAGKSAIVCASSQGLGLACAVLPGMVERRFGRVVSITSAMVTRPSGQMVASAGARAGQTMHLDGGSYPGLV